MNRIKHSLYFLMLLILINTECTSQTEDNKYAVAILNTPVLNTSDYAAVFGGARGIGVKLDSKGLIREMEFIAFPNTVFEILDVIQMDGFQILKVTTEDYPYNSDLYIDSRFVNIISTKPDNRNKSLPDKTEIITKLNSLEGFGYMWGGNYAYGIEELLEYYKPQTNLPDTEKDLWSLKGVDCSGLIYQATNGSTPRNTSSLIEYGKGLDIRGMSADEISKTLLPLDLITWSGHVIIVLDEKTVIESTPDLGVHKSDLLSRLKSVLAERNPVNDWSSTSGKRFVIRRWIDQ